MTVYALNPIADPRWAELVGRHPRASVFHTPGWLVALQRMYGYEPVAFTTSAPGAELTNGVVFCDVRSWLTGRRLVSLPFSDHCEPLVDHGDDLETICGHVAAHRRRIGWRHIELRTRQASPPQDFVLADEFWFHQLDLRPEPGALFQSLHKDSIRRKIRRAEREQLTCEAGTTELLLREFYQLLLQTRRRHRLPPQPFGWFSHLASAMGPALTVRVARLGQRPVASMVTLVHRDTMVFKYGASDEAFHPFGGVPLLFWKAMQDARASGCVALDLGRSDIENAGLATFKDRLGAERSTGSYWRYPAALPAGSPLRRYAMSGAKVAIGRAPAGVRAAAGRRLQARRLT